MIELYSNKIKVSGSYLFDNSYNYPISRGYSVNPHSNSKISNYNSISDFSNFYRARSNIKDLILTNYSNNPDLTTKFLTLTFADQTHDLDISNYRFKTFVQRLKYYFSQPVKYLNVPERHKSGAWHNHSVIFNMPYIPSKKISEIWGHGFIKIKKVDNAPHMADYVSKYLTKGRNESMMGRKSYFPSKSLSRPIEIIDELEVLEARMFLQSEKPVWSGVVENDYRTIFQKIYNLTGNDVLLSYFKG